VKTGCNLAGSSKEGYGSKAAIFPMMMMIIIITSICIIYQTCETPHCLNPTNLKN
jgi:hypothetical protein